MTSTLQDAISAVRLGDYEEAQRCLAEVIQANPDEVQAWYLMSQIVDSDARRAAYLSKTLALNPYHERAWAEFYSLPPDVVRRLEAEQIPSAPSEKDMVTPAAVTSVPNAKVAMAPVALSVTDLTTGQAVDVETALPDWLRPVAKDQPVVAQRRPAPATPTPEVSPPRVSPPISAEPAQGNRTLSVLLAILLIATILVLAFLVYLLLQN